MSRSKTRGRRTSRDDIEEALYSFCPKFAEMGFHQHNNSFNACEVPITFRHLSDLVSEMLDPFNSHTDLFTNANKDIYKKVCFVLAEIKLERSFSRNTFYHPKNPNYLKSIYDDTQLKRYQVEPVPYPIAFYLSSIGRFTNEGLNYYPTPAKTGNDITDACYSCMPCLFADVLNQLADGVKIEDVPEKARKSLMSLPAINWDIIENDAGDETRIRLTAESVDFWLQSRPENAPENQPCNLNFTDNDFDTFKSINEFIAGRCCRKGVKVMTDFTEDDEGNASQLVRSKEYTGSHEWYTMDIIPNHYMKLGAVFGFGHFEEKVQESRAVGDPMSARTSGEGAIKFVLHELVWPIRSAI